MISQLSTRRAAERKLGAQNVQRAASEHHTSETESHKKFRNTKHRRSDTICWFFAMRMSASMMLKRYQWNPQLMYGDAFSASNREFIIYDVKNN
jgi:hypothetical protein